MDPYKRTLYVSQLAAEIGSIGQAFEAFGGLVMNLVLKVPVGSQGINLRGFPVGGVVDGVSPDGLYAAEYSALQKYFDSSMGKARSDLRHVLAKAPHATEIYLLSSAVKATKIAQAFETDAMNWPEMDGRSLHLLGAVEIADAIIENALDNELAVRKLGHYLPSLSRFSEEEAAQALVPQPDSARIPRPEVDGLLDEIFAERNCVILAGLAGSGKSDAAAAYVHRNRQKYHTVLWLPGDNLKRIEDFQAVPITRMGELRNVAGLLKNRCCLVVVDDANESLASDALSSLCGPGSHVLLTRRAVTTEAHVIPPMSREDAQRLLTRNLSACPPRTWDMIWQAVGGHPLTISLLNAAVCEGATWADIEQDCRMPGTLESNGQILAERLLGRLRAASERGLALFEWAGTSQIDDKVIKALATPAVVRTLRKYGLTAASRPGVIRLHDVVYASLSAQSWWTQADRDAITDKVCAYMGNAALDTDLAFWSAAINQRAKIQRLVEEGDRRPAFIYAMLSAWSPSDVRPALLVDPLVDADLIAKGANLATPIATMALIETVEKLFLHDKLTSLRHAQQMLSQRIDVFDKLATAKGLTIKQQSEILHHKGKALVRLNREPEALGIFEGIMGGPQPLPETEIQIMRLLKKGDPLSQQRAIDIAKRIYNAATSNEPVSHSVFFAAVESGTTDLIIAHETLVTTMLIDAAELGVSQALQTMSTISRFLSREAPAVLNKLIAAIPPHVIEDLPVPQDRFAWADILFEASRIDGAPAESQRAESLSLFETLPPDRFHSQRHAELLLLMQRPLEARALLTKRDDLQDGPFAQRLMAIAEHQLGNPTVALEWIDQAFKNLSPKQEKYRYEFHEHRFDILAAIQSTFAVAELERAIELSAAGKEQERLKRRLVAFLETQ